VRRACVEMKTPSEDQFAGLTTDEREVGGVLRAFPGMSVVDVITLIKSSRPTAEALDSVDVSI
jgi:hypothetical protein